MSFPPLKNGFSGKLLRVVIYLAVLFAVVFLSGCCWLGFTCYELYVWGEPEFENADIYIDNKMIKKSLSGDIFLKISYERHEIKVVQEAYKPFIEVLEPMRHERGERRLLVKLEPLDSVSQTQTSPSDTAAK